MLFSTISNLILFILKFFFMITFSYWQIKSSFFLPYLYLEEIVSQLNLQSISVVSWFIPPMFLISYYISSINVPIFILIFSHFYSNFKSIIPTPQFFEWAIICHWSADQHLPQVFSVSLVLAFLAPIPKLPITLHSESIQLSISSSFLSDLGFLY